MDKFEENAENTVYNIWEERAWKTKAAAFENLPPSIGVPDTRSY
jgi:hypothetical protein